MNKYGIVNQPQNYDLQLDCFHNIFMFLYQINGHSMEQVNWKSVIIFEFAPQHRLHKNIEMNRMSDLFRVYKIAKFID